MAADNIDIGANVLGTAGEAKPSVREPLTRRTTFFVAGIFGTLDRKTVVVNSTCKLASLHSSARFKDGLNR